MTRLLFGIIVFLLSLPGSGFGYEILVIKSSRNQVNEHLQQSFIQELNQQIPHRGLKAIQSHQVRELVLDKGEHHETPDTIRIGHADLILALGSQALQLALTRSDIPIVYLLVIDPEPLIGTRTRVTGVSLHVPPRVQLAELSRLLPQVKRIGLIYDPEHSSMLIAEAQAARPDVDWVTLAAHQTSDVPDLLASLQGRIDLLWMLPDTTVTNTKTLQSYFLFSAQHKIPLLTFSEKLLKPGGTIAVTFDTGTMGEQGAGLAVALLSEAKLTPPPLSIPPRVKTVINHTIARKLQISIQEEGQNHE